MEEADNRLRPRLTPEFLSTLLEAAKTCGWGVDYHEIAEFVTWCFYVAGEQPPSAEQLEPYDYDN